MSRLFCGCPLDSGCDGRHESAYSVFDTQESPRVRYGWGDGGHPFAPDGRGHCKWAGSGYCDGTRADTAHERRTVPA